MKLPMTEPFIKSYLNNAYQLSILQCYENTKPWIFSNYIQLQSLDDNEYKITFYLPDDYGYGFSILTPFFDYKSINRDFIQKNNLSFINLISKSILSSEYVSFYVNEKYIPNTPANKFQYDFNHKIMIHGIEDNYVFYYGFDEKGIFREKKVNLEQLNTAYFNNVYNYPRFEDKLIIFHMTNYDLNLDFSIESIIPKLRHLLQSTIEISNVMDYSKNLHCIYGLSTIKKLAASIRLMAKQKIPINIQSLHLLMEHKIVMCERLKYLDSIYKSNSLSKYANQYLILSNKYKIIRNNVIKATIKQDFKILEYISDELLKLYDTEYVLLNNLINYLESIKNISN